MSILIRSLSSVLLLFLASTANAAVQYQVTEILNDNPNASFLSPDFLNDNGTVAGEIDYEIDGMDNFTFFTWNAENGLQIISPEGRDFDAFGLNNADEVIGCFEDFELDEYQDRNFIWSLSNGFEYIHLPHYGLVTAVNDSGLVAGIMYPNLKDDKSQLFLWDKNKGLKTFEFPKSLTKKYSGLLPRSMNNNGQILVLGINMEKKDFNICSFIWENEKIKFLKVPNSNSKHEVIMGEKINNLGEVAGSVAYNVDSFNSYGMVWMQDGKTFKIENQDSSVSVQGINDKGQVVGRYGPLEDDDNLDEDEDDDDFDMKLRTAFSDNDSDDEFENEFDDDFDNDFDDDFDDFNDEDNKDRAFIWDVESGFQDLTAQVNGYVIIEAIAINNKGQILAEAIKSGTYVSVLLTPKD